MIACQGVGGRRLLDQIGTVLDPIAADYRGVHGRELRRVLDEAWQTRFHAQLPEPALSRCVAAIRDGQPWQLALWSNDWN